ncbi:hypothetical protein JCM16303_001252 [Sporobolomyces ruberrimus]
MFAGFHTVLPADANPYLNLNGAYKSQLILKHPASSETQLFVLSIVHGITIVLLIASLVISWWKARFWLIRRRAPSPLLVLNFPVVGAIVAVALLTIFEVTIARSMQTFDGWLQRDYGFWLLFYGSTRHLIAETVIWSLMASTIVRNQLVGPQLKFWSYACNLLGMLTPILTIIAAVTLAVLGGIKYSTAVGAYDKLNAFFIEESLTWSPTNLTNRFVPPPGDLVKNFDQNLGGIERWWKMSFLFSGILGATLTAAAIVISVLYLFSLRKNVVKMGQTLDPTATARTESVPQKAHLKTTWTMLIGVLSTVILFSSMTLALEFYVYLRPFSFHSRMTSAALLFIPLYVSSLPGLAFGIALFYNASTAHSSSKDAEKGWRTIFVRRFLMKKRTNPNRGAGTTTIETAQPRQAEGVIRDGSVVIDVEDEKEVGSGSGPSKGGDEKIDLQVVVEVAAEEPEVSVAQVEHSMEGGAAKMDEAKVEVVVL